MYRSKTLATQEIGVGGLQVQDPHGDLVSSYFKLMRKNKMVKKGAQ